MKKFTKTLVGVLLASTMVFATSCGSDKNGAIEAIDSVIANYEGSTSYVLTSDMLDSGVEMSMVIKEDGQGDLYANISTPDESTDLYLIDDTVYTYVDGEDYTELLGTDGSAYMYAVIEEMQSALSESFYLTRDNFDSALLLDVSKDGDNYIITAEADTGGDAVITVAADGSYYSFESSTETSVFEFGGSVAIELP